MSATPSRRVPGGTARRRRQRHNEEDRARVVGRPRRAPADIEDFIYETWGAFMADSTASER